MTNLASLTDFNSIYIGNSVGILESFFGLHLIIYDCRMIASSGRAVP